MNYGGDVVQRMPDDEFPRKVSSCFDVTQLENKVVQIRAFINRRVSSLSLLVVKVKLLR